MIAEIGLNHNGDVALAKELIDVAADAGAQAVKFQKRTPEISTPEHMKDVLRLTPWGEMTYLDYRYRVEFSREQYIEIGDHATMRPCAGWTGSHRRGTNPASTSSRTCGCARTRSRRHP